MIDINVVEKLEKTTEELILDMIKESFYNIDLKIHLFSKKEESTIIVEDYVVKIKKHRVMDHLKTYYDIYKDNELLYSDICLTMTMINVLKYLLSKKPETQIQTLIILDEKYSAILGDMLFYKKLLKTVKSPIKKNIILAKYEGRYDSSLRIKEQIQKIYK